MCDRFLLAMQGGVGIRGVVECTPQFTRGQPKAFLDQSLQFGPEVEFAQGEVHGLRSAGDDGRRHDSFQVCFLNNIQGHSHTEEV